MPRKMFEVTLTAAQLDELTWTVKNRITNCRAYLKRARGKGAREATEKVLADNEALLGRLEKAELVLSTKEREPENANS